MNKGTKKGCLWGCGLVTLILVAIAGAGTWYAANMTKDFNQVKASEEALVAAVASQGTYKMDLVHPPAPERIEAFLEVRRGLEEWALNLERSVAEFKAARDEDTGGPWGFFKSLRAGTELAPVYAGFWQKRNELLLEQQMGPEEYAFLYRLIFQTWLGHDPQDGEETPTGTTLATGKNEVHTLTSPPVLKWAGDPGDLAETLAPFRHALAKTYRPVLNPLEFLFVETAETK